MSPLASSSVPIPRLDVTFERLQDGSAVLVDAQARSYALNATGADAWELCTGANSIDQICEALLERYETTPDVIQETLESLLMHFQELHLISFGSAPYTP
jgi:hypothetical protein